MYLAFDQKDYINVLTFNAVETESFIYVLFVICMANMMAFDVMLTTKIFVSRPCCDYISSLGGVSAIHSDSSQEGVHQSFRAFRCSLCLASSGYSVVYLYWKCLAFHSLLYFEGNLCVKHKN